MHSLLDDLIVACGLLAVVAALAWRLNARRKARGRLLAGLSDPEPLARIATIEVIAAAGLGRFATACLHVAHTDADGRVLHALATAVARNQWEPIDSAPVVELRLWASLHQLRAAETAPVDAFLATRVAGPLAALPAVAEVRQPADEVEGLLVSLDAARVRLRGHLGALRADIAAFTTDLDRDDLDRAAEGDRAAEDDRTVEELPAVREAPIATEATADEEATTGVEADDGHEGGQRAPVVHFRPRAQRHADATRVEAGTPDASTWHTAPESHDGPPGVDAEDARPRRDAFDLDTWSEAEQAAWADWDEAERSPLEPPPRLASRLFRWRDRSSSDQTNGTRAEVVLADAERRVS